MEFYNKLRSFLGLQSPQDGALVPRNEEAPNYSLNKNEDHPRHYYGNSRNFDVFSDPLEITKHFEQEMNGLLKIFMGTFGRGLDFKFSDSDFEESAPPGFHSFSGNFFNFDEPNSDENNPSSGNLRNFYLKPGYEPNRRDSHVKEDKDMDGKIDLNELGTILDRTESQPTTRPKFNFQTFGKQSSSQFISRPDGSQEIHNTTKDSEGNIETKITRKIGDKEYTVIKRQTKDGTESITENFKNVDQNDVHKYFPPIPEQQYSDHNSSSFGFFNIFK